MSHIRSLTIVAALSFLSVHLLADNTEENPLIYRVAASILTQYLPEISEQVCLVTIRDEDICETLNEAVARLIDIKGVGIYKGTVKGINYVVNKGRKHSSMSIETSTYRKVSYIKKGLEFLAQSNCINWSSIECLSCLDENVIWDPQKIGPNGEFYGVFRDIRDGNEYNVILANKQIWFIEPINFDDDYDYKEISGVGYYTGGYKLDSNVCPEGWKVPSKDDLKNLLKSYNITLKSRKFTIIEKGPFEDFLSTGFFRKESGHIHPSSKSFFNGGFETEYSIGITKYYWLSDNKYFQFNRRLSDDYYFSIKDPIKYRFPCLCIKRFDNWSRLKRMFSK